MSVFTFYSKIVDKIDADEDGFVTEAELKAWIKKAQKKYIYDNVDRQWRDFDMNNDGMISWEEYKNVTYGTFLGKRIGKILPWDIACYSLVKTVQQTCQVDCPNVKIVWNCCPTEDPDPDDGYNYKQMMARDERRFKRADTNGDHIANKEEFTAFLHPEEYDHMKDIVVLVRIFFLIGKSI